MPAKAWLEICGITKTEGEIQMRTLTTAALASSLLAGCSTVKEPAYDTLIAHRGESYDAPENTLPAFRMAVDRGFGFECDIYLSTDRRLFTFHDASLSRTTNGACTNMCTEVSWADTVSKVNVGGWGKWRGSKYDPTSPALLEDVLKLARDGRFIYVEVKGNNPGWVPYIKDVFARQSNATPRNVLFISFGARVCAELKRQMPEYRTYWLTSARMGKGGNATPITVEHVLKVLKETGVDGVDCQFIPGVITSEFVKTVKDAGYEFHMWTIDDAKTAELAFERGADTVTTNRAQGIMEERMAK